MVDVVISCLDIFFDIEAFFCGNSWIYESFWHVCLVDYFFAVIVWCTYFGVIGFIFSDEVSEAFIAFFDALAFFDGQEQ